MESHDDENGWEGDERSAYGSFQEYDDGNYQQFWSGAVYES
jgi:hypothetical protein